MKFSTWYTEYFPQSSFISLPVDLEMLSKVAGNKCHRRTPLFPSRSTQSSRHASYAPSRDRSKSPTSAHRSSLYPTRGDNILSVPIPSLLTGAAVTLQEDPLALLRHSHPAAEHLPQPSRIRVLRTSSPLLQPRRPPSARGPAGLAARVRPAPAAGGCSSPRPAAGGGPGAGAPLARAARGRRCRRRRRRSSRRRIRAGGGGRARGGPARLEPRHGGGASDQALAIYFLPAMSYFLPAMSRPGIGDFFPCLL
jgi:hypothetical protein